MRVAVGGPAMPTRLALLAGLAKLTLVQRRRMQLTEPSALQLAQLARSTVGLPKLVMLQ